MCVVQKTAFDSAHKALTWLRDNSFIHMTTNPNNPQRGGLWHAKDLGLATCASGLTPEQALTVQRVAFDQSSKFCTQCTHPSPTSDLERYSLSSVLAVDSARWFARDSSQCLHHIPVFQSALVVIGMVSNLLPRTCRTCSRAWVTMS